MLKPALITLSFACLAQTALADVPSKIQIPPGGPADTLLNTMEDVASEGPSLAAFFHSQSFWFEGNFAACDVVQKEGVVDHLRTYVADTFEGGVGTVEGYETVIEKGLLELSSLLPDETFRICHDSRTEFMSFITEDFIISPSFRLSLSSAYED